jgi:hypothetical protein
VERPVVAKLRFREPCSRLVFGIPDPTGQLQHGQAFFQPLLDEEATALRGCALVVSMGKWPWHDLGCTHIAC